MPYVFNQIGLGFIRQILQKCYLHIYNRTTNSDDDAKCTGSLSDNGADGGFSAQELKFQDSFFLFTLAKMTLVKP